MTSPNRASVPTPRTRHAVASTSSSCDCLASEQTSRAPSARRRGLAAMPTQTVHHECTLPPAKYWNMSRNNEHYAQYCASADDMKFSILSETKNPDGTVTRVSRTTANKNPIPSWVGKQVRHRASTQPRPPSLNECRRCGEEAESLNRCRARGSSG